ncbi:MAG: glycosyltransferase, partial [Bdellovibrionales bacterium]|nr:glycosyltransferase [Bdellovibrionales bacterium]
FAHLVEEVSGSDYPELPTCVGFCTYMRREALDRCGAFRVEAFPRGYGEENDLSLRFSSAGYCHLLDTTTFIYHSGSASFQEDKSELMEQGQKIIEKLYPHYADDIARFYVQNPLLPYQQRVQEALLKYWLESKEGVVLQILHNGPYVSRVDPLGGTERCVQGLIEDLPHLAHWSLVVSEAQYILSAHMGGYHREFYFPLAEISLRDIVSAELFPLVHVHHTRWFDQSHLAEALAEHPNVILSIHDFVLGCPRFHLITPEGEHCDTKSCSSVCGLSKSFMVSYRDAGQKLLSQASKAICFSDSSRRLLSKMFTLPESLEVVSHGISVTRNASYEVSRKEDEPLRVAVFGHLVAHKGEELFRKLFLHSKLPSASKVEWHLFGSEAPIQREHITSYGRYTPENLPEMVMQSGAHCALFLSRCPETYSLAVDEAWACGLPVVVSPLGAPRERVERSGAGWVVESLTEEVVLSLLDTIASNSQELMTKVSAVQKVNLLTRRDEAEQLSRHYKSSPRAGKDYEALL